MPQRSPSAAAPWVRILMLVVLALLLVGGGAWWYYGSGRTRLTESFAATVLAQLVAPLPKIAHVVVIIEENKDYSAIVGNDRDAPYINSLIPKAALFTNAHAVAHPSQPNYMALFSGRTNTDGDSCAVTGLPRSTPSLGGDLLAAHDTFAGYAESLPRAGFMGCYAGNYARKHAPWTHFADVPATDDLPYSEFPSDYSRLPTVSFVIPNLLDDMHSASIARGDDWLKSHVAPLIAWAMTHHTLVILTWDEDDGSRQNHIPTLFIGQDVKPGRYPMIITHYSVLSTIEKLYGLKPLGHSAQAAPIEGIWR